MGETHIFYSITSFLIKIYKWIEFHFLRSFLFSNYIEAKVISTYKAYTDINFYGEGVTPNKKNKNHFDKNQNVGKNKADIQVYNKLLFSRVAAHASLGMGEAYMDGWWDCEDLEEFSYRVLKSGIFMEYLTPWNRFLNWVELSFFNLQSQDRAWEVGKKHYDTGNDLFESFLDPWMTYSCGYWAKATTLDQAQLDKMELIAQKLHLKPGMTVLDIGCGWGGLCKYLAKHHGVKCVGITISEQGVKYAKANADGLSVEYRLMDYRDLDETFDRVVSVGMFEHVGHKNYRTFFEVVHRCLKNDGIFLLHTIGHSNPDMPGVEPFFHTYIFPNGFIPYHQDITKYTEGLYTLEDWHNFGHYYNPTLLAWHANFVKNWPKIQHKYGQRFYRMWTYYLLLSAGAFRARKYQVWQIVLSKEGVQGGYLSVR